MSTLLLALSLVGVAHAQDSEDSLPEDLVPVEETAEEVPVENAEEAESVEDAEEAEPVEIFDEEAEPEPEPVVEEAPATGPQDVMALGYRDGFSQGQEDAVLAGNYGLHGLAGFAGGCIIGPCGCVAVPALEAVISPEVPPGGWQAYSPEYQRGYIDGYRREVQKKRVIYSLAGASLGTLVGVGAGFALGATVF